MQYCFHIALKKRDEKWRNRFSLQSIKRLFIPLKLSFSNPFSWPTRKYFRWRFIVKCAPSCFLVRGNFRNIRLPLSLRIVLATSFKALRFSEIIGRNELFIVQLLAGRLIYDKSQDLEDQAKILHPNFVVLRSTFSPNSDNIMRSSPLWRS